VERARRILRDVRDDLSADAPQRPLVARENRDPADGDGAATDRDARPRVAEQGEGSRRLPAAGLADEAEDLARPDGQVDPVDDALPGRELEAEILDPYHRRPVARSHAAALRVGRGTYERPRLRAIASPVRLIPIVRSAIIPAGASTAHGAREM